MRENRPYGSEGGESGSTGLPYPYRPRADGSDGSDLEAGCVLVSGKFSAGSFAGSTPSGRLSSAVSMAPMIRSSLTHTWHVAAISQPNRPESQDKIAPWLYRTRCDKFGAKHMTNPPSACPQVASSNV
jgi:hypothetical protein